MASVELRGLTRRYGTQVVVDNVSLTISAGELVSIVGPNGAGKTTLINVLTGLLKRTIDGARGHAVEDPESLHKAVAALAGDPVA